MKASGRNYAGEVLGHVFHVVWEACAVIGMLTLLGLASPDTLSLSPPGWPVLVGLAFGVATSPIMVRWLRPSLARRFPWAFRDATTRT